MPLLLLLTNSGWAEQVILPKGPRTHRPLSQTASPDSASRGEPWQGFHEVVPRMEGGSSVRGDYPRRNALVPDTFGFPTS